VEVNSWDKRGAYGEGIETVRTKRDEGEEEVTPERRLKILHY